MPFKSRSEPHEALTGENINIPSGTVMASWTRTPNVPATSEVIVDEELRKRRYGNCKHWKTRYQHWPSICPFSVEAIVDGKFVSYDYLLDTSCVYSRVDLSFPSSLDKIPNFSGLAFSTMKPSLSGDLALTVFLAEVTQLKSLLDIFKALDFSKLKRLRKQIAGDYLNWSFGWMPTFAELSGMWDLLGAFEKRLRDFKSRSGSTQVRHFKLPLEDLSESEDFLWHYEVKSRTRRITSREYNATMKFTYSISNLDLQYSQLRGLADMLGLKFGAAVLWELIPFSFVVDWFFNVGDYLSQFEKDYLDSQVTIIDFCHSYKAKVEDTWTLSNRGSDAVCFGTHTAEIYRRERTIPDTKFGITESNRYGTKQIILSAALLMS